MLKKLCLLGIISLFLIGVAGAQPWLNSIEKQDPNFFEKQAAFEEYWEGRSYEKGKGWKQFKRWEWFMETRVDENGELDPMALWRGWQEYQQRFAPDAIRTGEHWTNLGPESEIPIDGGAGRVNCIAFHPFDSNIIWVGSPSGGLWKSTDAGVTWSSNTDHLPVLGVTSILVHPDNPDIMYIATGDGDAGDTYSIGVLKSTDAGDSWQLTGLNWNITDTQRISKLMFHPNDTDMILAAASNGIYKTTDAGETWVSNVSGTFFDIEVDPVNPDIWFGARASAGIYRSIDAGDTWEYLSEGLPGGGFGRIAIGITGATYEPGDPSVIYALYTNNSSGFYGMYRSVDGGDTWTQQSNSPNLLGWQWDGSDSGGQGWYDLTIGVDPGDPDVVYVGGVNKWKSTDGGVTWTLIAHWYGGGAPYVHADHHAFEFLPGNDEVIFSGNDGGLFKSTDGGQSWVDLSDGLGIHQFYRLGTSATNENVYYGGAQDNGTSRHNDNGWARVIGGDGMECLVDYSNENIAYGEIYYNQMYRTLNGGYTFDPINNGVMESGAWVAPFTIHPNNPQVLYRGTTRVYHTTNRGNMWYPLSPSFGQRLHMLVVSNSHPEVIYTSNYSGLYKTTNAGQDWFPLSSAPTGISYLAIHPENPDIVWTTYGGYNPTKKLYRTTDGGENWQNLTGDLPNIPMNSIAIDPAAPDQLYLATELGVMFSADAGDTWVDFSGGLPNVIVNELEVHEATAKIRAATYGRGMWESELNNGEISGTVTIADSDDNAGARVYVAQYPNIETISDAAGNFTLQKVPSGTFTIEAAMIGYQTGREENVTVEIGETTSGLEFNLALSGPPPVNLTADNNYDNLVYLDWENPAGQSPVGYRVYRSSTTGGPYAFVGSTDGNAFVDDQVDNFSLYYYVVTAIYDNPAGESFFSNEALAIPGEVYEFPYHATFENDQNGFGVLVEAGDEGGMWEWGIPTTGPQGGYNTPHCWGTGLNENYGPNVDMWLISPKIDLTEVSEAYLMFSYWLESEAAPSGTAGFDGGRLLITTDYGQNWQVIEPLGGYPSPNVLVFDWGPGFSGSSDGWDAAQVNLTAYTGQMVRIAFQFKSNDVTELDGWFIDEMLVNSTLSVEDVPGDEVESFPFALQQNRPNPFNPLTTIAFSIPTASQVELKVFDVSGREVETLLNKKLDAGQHEVEFNAGDLPSGVYLYRLEAGSQTDTRRMVLLK